MVSLKDVQLSNSRIASTLPPHLVAVFVGATSGIGETSLKQFAKHARQPRIYFIGRSQESAGRISSELKSLNSEGKYIFVKADTSLISNVDEVCDDIKSKETAINILFLCTGALYRKDTSEGLDFAASLAYYSRIRFIVNLLPLLQHATALRRVITVLAGTKEGPVDTTDLAGRNVSLLAQRGHSTSIVTLSLESLAKKAPDVSFIHNYPGAVKTNLVRGGEGAAVYAMKIAFKIFGPIFFLSNKECGERHAFLATSARYPASTDKDAAVGVPVAGGVGVARGTNGKVGSGVYSINWDGESADHKTEAILANHRKERVAEKVWKHTEDEFNRIASLRNNGA